MAFLKKTIDTNNSFNYCCDSQTVGTYSYFKNKFGDKFEDFQYMIFEILSRKEYENVDEEIQKIKEDAIKENNKIIEEWNAIQLENCIQLENGIQLENAIQSENLDLNDSTNALSLK